MQVGARHCSVSHSSVLSLEEHEHLTHGDGDQLLSAPCNKKTSNSVPTSNSVLVLGYSGIFRAAFQLLIQTEQTNSNVLAVTYTHELKYLTLHYIYDKVSENLPHTSNRTVGLVVTVSI